MCRRRGRCCRRRKSLNNNKEFPQLPTFKIIIVLKSDLKTKLEKNEESITIIDDNEPRVLSKL